MVRSHQILKNVETAVELIEALVSDIYDKTVQGFAKLKDHPMKLVKVIWNKRMV